MTPALARSIVVATFVVAILAAFGVGKAVEDGAFAGLFSIGPVAEEAGGADAGDADPGNDDAEAARDGGDVAPGPPDGVPEDAQRAAVDRIVDGDTIRVAVTDPGRIPAAPSVPVRLLNVDTPETRHPSRDVECGGPEATAFVEDMLPVGSAVWVAADRSDTDRYDRHLRAVWTADGAFVNAALVEEGLGVAVLYPPDDRWYDELAELEDAARAAGAGNWSRCP